MRFVQQPRRTRNLCIRLSEDEMLLLESVAARERVTVTQIVRAALAATLEPAAPGVVLRDDNGRSDPAVHPYPGGTQGGEAQR
jgi:hypothetical protein